MRLSPHKPIAKIMRILVLGLCLCLTTACHAQPEDDSTGVGITGIDHLADHLSVQNFWVNDYNAFRAGAGSGHVCCAVLPAQWRPDLSVKIRWNVTNWRDCTGEEFERQVSVERYEEVGTLYVHFLADGSVRVISANYAPWSPVYPGPHDIIPNKKPWDVYSLDTICKEKHK